MPSVFLQSFSTSSKSAICIASISKLISAVLAALRAMSMSSLSRSAFGRKIHFKYFVMGESHAEVFVRLTRARIRLVHIQANAADIRTGTRKLLQIFEERAKNAVTPKFFFHVYALNPPDIAITPITPLISNHDLAHHMPFHHGHMIYPL